MFSRDGSLLPFGYADARCIDAAIVSKATDDSATDWVLSTTFVKSCCNDPVVWKAGGRWYVGVTVGLPAFWNVLAGMVVVGVHRLCSIFHELFRA